LWWLLLSIKYSLQWPKSINDIIDRSSEKSIICLKNLAFDFIDFVCQYACSSVLSFPDCILFLALMGLLNPEVDNN